MNIKEISDILKKLGCIPSEDKLQYLDEIIAKERFEGYKEGWNDLEKELDPPNYFEEY